MIPIGLIEGIISKEMKNDYFGTLEKVAQIGYKGIELADNELYTSSQIKLKLDELGLKAICYHSAYFQMVDDIDKIIDNALNLDCKYVVMVWSPCDSKEWILENAKLINRMGEKCRVQGIQMCYHNHDHEFKIYDGEYGLDILFKETDPELLKAQIDTYWVKYAGVDPVEYIKKLNDRCRLVHFKDMANDERRSFTEIGTGILDFKQIAKAAVDSGAQWFTVEQDKPYNLPPMESIKVSYENLKAMGLA